MYAIYLGRKHQLRHLLALLSSIRARPISDSDHWDEWQALYLCYSQIKRQDEPESLILLGIKSYKWQKAKKMILDGIEILV